MNHELAPFCTEPMIFTAAAKRFLVFVQRGKDSKLFTDINLVSVV